MTAAASRCAVLWRVERQRFGTPVGDDADGRVLLERIRQIDQRSVDDAGERGLREARRDRFRDVADGCAGRQLAARPIRKRDGDLTH